MKNKIIIACIFFHTISNYAMFNPFFDGMLMGHSSGYRQQPTPQEFCLRAHQLLATNTDLNAPNSQFCDEPPLIRLSYYEECADVIEALLKKGANSNISFERRIPLEHAVFKRSDKIVKLLLEYGADPNQPYDTEKRNVLPDAIRDPIMKSWTPTTIHITKEIIKLLLAYRCNIDGKGLLNNTALHQAVDAELMGYMTAQKELRKYFVGLFLYHGANTKLKNYQKLTAAERARQSGFPELATLIEKSHKPLVAKMTRLLSYTGTRGKGHSPFPRDIAFVVAEWRYRNTGV